LDDLLQQLRVRRRLQVVAAVELPLRDVDTGRGLGESVVLLLLEQPVGDLPPEGYPEQRHDGHRQRQGGGDHSQRDRPLPGRDEPPPDPQHRLPDR